MRRGICVLLLVWLCMGQAWAVELPGELLNSVPPSAAEIGAAEGWEQGSRNLVALIQDSFLQLLRKGLKGVVSLLLVVVLCGLAETMLAGVKGREGFSCLDLAAAAAVAMVAAGDFTHLMGLGQRTVLELDQFSKVLLPTIAAATASMGLVSIRGTCLWAAAWNTTSGRYLAKSWRSRSRSRMEAISTARSSRPPY